MKKLLLGTAALAGGNASAEPTEAGAGTPVYVTVRYNAYLSWNKGSPIEYPDPAGQKQIDYIDREPDIQGYTVKSGSYIALHIDLEATGHVPAYAAPVGCGSNRNRTNYAGSTVQGDYTPPTVSAAEKNGITFACDYDDYVLEIPNR